MSSLFCFMLPSVLGLVVYKSLVKEDNKINLLLSYLLLVLFSNTINLVLVEVLNKFDGSLVEYVTYHSMFALKYIIISLISNVFLGYVFGLIKKNFAITLEMVDANEKKSSKKNN